MEPMLPSPQNTEIPAGNSIDNGTEAAVGFPESAPITSEQSPGSGQPTSVQVVQQSTQSDNSSPVVGDTSVSTTDSAGPALADDLDVIEKEWVDKARKIVEATKDNPYQQEKEVSKLQADYLMKRYGKKVKTAE